MYYDFPSFDEAYLIDPNGNYAQYMIGSDMMVAPGQYLPPVVSFFC